MNARVQILQFLRTFKAQIPVSDPGTGRYGEHVGVHSCILNGIVSVHALS